MKIKIGHIILLIMTVLAVSCSKDDSQKQAEEPTPLADKPIVFSGTMQEETSVTRANLETFKTLFTVYGYKNTAMDGDSYTDYQTVFPGYTVNWAENTANTTTTNSYDWEYVGQELLGQAEQTAKYWDWSAKAYRFFGITKTFDNIEGEVADGAFNLTFRVDLTSETGTDAVPYYSHLWFSNNNYPTSPQYGMPVMLTFLRPICSVRIMFVYEDPSNYDRTNTPLEDINFHRTDGVTIKQKGKVIISYPLTGTEKTETCTFDKGASGITGFSQESYDDPSTTSVIEEYWYTVLPVTDQGTFTLDVTVDGEPKQTIVPAEFMDWKPGNKYTYIFKIHVDGRVSIDAVQAAFTGWDVTPGNHIIYNW